MFFIRTADWIVVVVVRHWFVIHIVQDDKVMDGTECNWNMCLDLEGITGRQEKNLKSFLEYTKCTFNHIVC